MSTRTIPDVLILLLVVFVVIFLWRQGEYGVSPKDESRLAALTRPR
ncbi:MAG TPA: hypothetical protein VFX54_05545 [Candidatus Binatia bacterium]|nr:hypothetical protein [Candidatus Binatia bacterium]